MATTVQTAGDTKPSTATCPSCSEELQGKFCHRCGEKQFHPGELSVRHFLAHAVEEFTHLDSKVFATVRYLFTRPGFLTAEFVAGRRSRYMKPLSLFLAASALLLLANSIRPRSPYDVRWLTKVDQAKPLNALLKRLAAKKHIDQEVLIERIQDRENHLVTAAQFSTVLAMALALALAYRKHYFVEHLVAAFHYFSFNYLLWVIFWPVTSGIGVSGRKSVILILVTSTVYLSYLFISLRHIYSQPAGITIAKTIFIYLTILAIQIVTPTAALLIAIMTIAN